MKPEPLTEAELAEVRRMDPALEDVCRVTGHRIWATIDQWKESNRLAVQDAIANAEARDRYREALREMRKDAERWHQQANSGQPIKVKVAVQSIADQVQVRVDDALADQPEGG